MTIFLNYGTIMRTRHTGPTANTYALFMLNAATAFLHQRHTNVNTHALLFLLAVFLTRHFELYSEENQHPIRKARRLYVFVR